MISIPGCSSRMSASSRAANRTSFWRHTKTPLVASVLLLLVVATAGAGSMVSGQQHDKFSLLIGNAAYPGADTPLTDTVTDARALGEELHRQGFDVDVGENLSKAAMQQMLERLYTKITPGSTALVFFGGYGVQSNRESYMIPIDARIWVESDVKRDGFSLDTVLAEMDRRGARVKIAILDASRRNPFERLFRSGSAGLGAISAPQGTAVMMSAAPYSLVSESESGVFMSELLKEMRVAGATVDGVFNRTRTGVSRATKSQQVPWFSSSLEEEFSFQSSSRPVNARPEPRPVPKPQPAISDPSPTSRPQHATPEPSPTPKPQPTTLEPSPVPRTQPATSEPSAAPKPQPTMPAASDALDPAIRKLDEVLRTNTDVSDLFKRGQLHAQKADFSRAIDDFNEVIRINPEHVFALNNRCWARAILGEDLQGALKDCNEALRLNPSYVDAWDSRGMVNLKIGSVREAIADYDSALRINPKHASALYARGVAKLRSGNTEAGKRDIDAATSIKSNIAEEFATYGIRQ
jgi:tetratricopeptide (TPR) repeat protein